MIDFSTNGSSAAQEHAGVVHVKQYREWRSTGIAFEFGDQRYETPNRTMTSFAEGLMKRGAARGQKREVRGSWLGVVAWQTKTW